MDTFTIGAALKSRTVCVDLDGTLCTNSEGAYRDAKPLPKCIAAVNRYYDEGHRIIVYTARGSTTGIDWREETERQLAAWGVRYHQLVLGKPTADVYIDDKGINTDDWQREGFALRWPADR